MNRTTTNTLTAVRVQVTVFAVTAVMLFLMAVLYPSPASAAESQNLAVNQTLAAGSSEWIPFDYTGGNAPIELWMDSANDSITFAVWIPAQLAGEHQEEPVGRGTENEYMASDLYWTGEFAVVGTYYVEVQNPTDTADTYSLSIQSDGVTVQSLTESVMNDSTGEINGGGGTESESITAAESALPMVGQWQAIAPGETVWFTVAYSGNREKMEVWAETNSGDVRFAVYTTTQVANGDEPVGRGSADENTPGDLYWTGNFMLPDTLHIAVTNNGTMTTYYNLHINQ